MLGKGEKVKITFSDRQVAFIINIDEDEAESSGLVDQLYLVSKVVDGNYPNYQQVIPDMVTHRIAVDRDYLLGV